MQPPFDPGSNKCQLCLMEKVAILYSDKESILNKRHEIFSKCIHRKYHLLKKLKNVAVQNQYFCSLLFKYVFFTVIINKHVKMSFELFIFGSVIICHGFYYHHHHWRCTIINHPLSHPLESLYKPNLVFFLINNCLPIDILFF